MSAEKVVIGNATLYHGDCREVLPMLQRHDLLLTDPPYGIGESSRRNATRGKPFGSRVDAKNTRGTYVPPTDYGAYQWDESPPDSELLDSCISAADAAVIWGGNFFGLQAASKWLVWDKLNSGDFADCELAWTNLPGAVRIFRHMWNGMLRDSERSTPRVHPTQKPVALIGWCMSQTDAQNVLDPFMGSGTTGVACAQLGKAFTGIERERKYFDIACERISRAQAQGSLLPPEEARQPEQEPLL
jgi:site-specific DNA-methyltransferase (adenine-specific)/modification methylase